MEEANGLSCIEWENYSFARQDIMKVAGKVLLENIEIPERGQIGV